MKKLLFSVWIVFFITGINISTASPFASYGSGEGKGRCQIVTGGAGVSVTAAEEPSLWWLEKSESKRHFCNIDIDGGILTLKAMDANRVVFDELVLEKSTTCTSDLSVNKSLVHPNPTDEVFNIKVPPGEIFSYRIFNFVGHLISEAQNNGVNANHVQFEHTNLPSGIYYIELNIDKENESKKLFYINAFQNLERT